MRVTAQIVDPPKEVGSLTGHYSIEALIHLSRSQWPPGSVVKYVSNHSVPEVDNATGFDARIQFPTSVAHINGQNGRISSIELRPLSQRHDKATAM